MNSRNKWLYADHLEEVLGKPEEAEIARAMPLAEWDPLEARAMEILAAARSAARRGRQAERTRRWRLKKAKESQRELDTHAPPATGDPYVDAARSRLSGRP